MAVRAVKRNHKVGILFTFVTLEYYEAHKSTKEHEKSFENSTGLVFK